MAKTEKIDLLSPRVFFQNLAKSNVPPVVLFINCKGGLWEKAIRKLRQELLGDHWNMHYTELEGKEASFTEITNRLLTTPLMVTRRMVVVKEVEEFWKSLGKKREDLITFLSSYTGKNMLVLAANGDLDMPSYSRKTHPLVSLVNKQGMIVTTKPRNREELRRWVIREIQKAKLETDPSFVEWLVEESVGNVGFIENEIEKKVVSTTMKI